MPYTTEQIQRVSCRYRYDARSAYASIRDYAERNALALLRRYEADYQWSAELAHRDPDTFVYCEDCGETIGYVKDGVTVYRHPDYVVEIDDMAYCDGGCANNSGFYECYRCGEWVHEDDSIYIENVGTFCSDYCAEREGFIRCDNCREWVHRDDATDVEGETWCESCVDHDASYCDHCEEYVREGHIYYHEGADQYVCESCYRSIDEEEGYSALHSYGFTPSLVYRGNAANSPYLGTELETDGGHRRGSYVRDLHESGADGKRFDEHFWMTQDSSLQNGVEITSHPMTLSYHVALAPLYGVIGETAAKYGFGSHDGGRCGLHIHVNRDFFGRTKAMQDACGYKMMRLLQRFENQFTAFSRRVDNYWCNYHTSNCYTPKKDEVRISMHEIEPSLFAKSNSMMGERRHEQALNFQHPETFEFRIFRGTLKWGTYYAALALVNGMCHTVKHHGSVWVENVDWYTLIDEIIERVDEPTAQAHLEAYLDEKELR